MENNNFPRVAEITRFIGVSEGSMFYKAREEKTFFYRFAFFGRWKHGKRSGCLDRERLKPFKDMRKSGSYNKE